VAEETLVRRHRHPRAVNLVPGGFATKLPNTLANLRNGLSWDRLAEAGKTT
jgi:hypothetical protein